MMLYVAQLILIALVHFKELQHESLNPHNFLPALLIKQGNLKVRPTKIGIPFFLHSCNIPFSKQTITFLSVLLQLTRHAGEMSCLHQFYSGQTP